MTDNTSKPPIPLPAVAPGLALYDSRAVGIATFFGTPLAGTVLMGINYRRLGKTAAGIGVVIVGAIATVLLIAIGFAMAQGSSAGVGIGALFGTYYAANGRILHYVYNSGLDTTISRVSGVADDNGSGGNASPDLEDYSYLGLGTIIQRAHGQPSITLDLWGGTSGTYAGLDNFGRVIDQKWTGPSSTITDEFQYGYDRDSNALYKNNTQISSLSELYHANSVSSGDNATAYDNINRLNGFRRGTLSSSSNNGSSLDTVTTTSSLSNHAEAWSLDALGNWSSQTVDGGSAVSRTHNSKSELTAITGLTSPTFDNNGNMTTDQNDNTLKYDAWNRLISVTNSSSVVLASYAYDALGWRVQETHSSTTTDCYFDNKWQLIEERQSSTVTNQYVWSQAYIDCLVLRDDNSSSGNLGISGSGLGRRLYVQQDADWNTTALVNTAGAAQERFIYDPYGNANTLTSSGTSITDAYNWLYLYHEGRLDSSTGLYDFRHRPYTSALGRWIVQDDYRDGMNTYQYVNSEPIIRDDPGGLSGLPGGFPVPSFPFIAGRGHFSGSLGYNDDYSSSFNLTFIFNDAGKCNCNQILFMQYVNESGTLHLDNEKDEDILDTIVGGPLGYQGIPYLYPYNLGGNAMADLPGASGWFSYFVQNFGEIDQHFYTTAICWTGKEARNSYGTIEWRHEYHANWVERWIGDDTHIAVGERTSPAVRAINTNYVPTN